MADSLPDVRLVPLEPPREAPGLTPEGLAEVRRRLESAMVALREHYRTIAMSDVGAALAILDRAAPSPAAPCCSWGAPHSGLCLSKESEAPASGVVPRMPTLEEWLELRRAAAGLVKFARTVESGPLADIEDVVDALKATPEEAIRGFRQQVEWEAGRVAKRAAMTQAEIQSVVWVLRTAASRLWEHHRVDRELVVGEVCDVCRPEHGVDVFSEIQGAKELLLTKMREAP